ncbi:hypothetical protein LCGC14_0967460 [marine sediment metagenome]|uniref:Uncharacterized protein n=1 Tax=marine sediment metagenome TaxID=412755 RepID=A0A0F9NYV5_9ZZZZ
MNRKSIYEAVVIWQRRKKKKNHERQDVGWAIDAVGNHALSVTPVVLKKRALCYFQVARLVNVTIKRAGIE